MPCGVFRCISVDFGVFRCISVFTLSLTRKSSLRGVGVAAEWHTGLGNVHWTVFKLQRREQHSKYWATDIYRGRRETGCG